MALPFYVLEAERQLQIINRNNCTVILALDDCQYYQDICHQDNCSEDLSFMYATGCPINSR